MKIDKAKIRYVDNDEGQVNKVKKSRVSAYTEDFKGEYYNIKLEKLIPFKNQARIYFDQESLNSLAQTIKEHGVRQPLTVIPSEENSGCYEIVSGERRFRAAKQAGLQVVPCIIIHDKKRAEEIAIIENIQRKDLHPVELKNAYQNLLDHKICNTVSDISRKLSVSRTSIVDILNLQRLSEEVQRYIVKEGVKNRDFLRELCKIEEEDKQLSKVNNYLNQQKQTIKSKGKTLQTKAKVLEVVLEGDKIKINKNRTDKLTNEQKEQLKGIFQNILT